MSKTVSQTSPLRTDFLPQGAFGQTNANRLLLARHVFSSCLLLIVGVSIYDSYLVALYRDFILYDERNPICELLIRRDPENLSWFMIGKLAGNLGVVGTLTTLRWIGYQQTLVVAIGVAMFQLGLLGFLTFSDPLTGILHFDDLFSQDPARAAKALYSAMVHGIVFTAILTGGVITGVKWKTTRNNSSSEPIAA